LEHDILDSDDGTDEGAVVSTEKTSSFNTPATIWNAKVSIYSFVFASILEFFFVRVSNCSSCGQ
jgi:hypothetical protein